ncbi:MAG: hypothetical protein ABFC89_11570 [Methanospirillum sp.]
MKSAAYVQTWKQTCPSTIRFDISEHQCWDSKTGEFGEAICRHADCYVFCLLAERDRDLVDPLDLAQWQFYVLPTPTINRIFGSQKTVSLSRIEECCQAVVFTDLRIEIDRVLFDGPARDGADVQANRSSRRDQNRP